MEDASGDPRVGRVLQDRYRIVGVLDEGATGTVYRAERVKLGRNVAVKFLHPRFAADRNFMKRFEREALAMSRLGHPHCVSVLDFGVDEGPYIVMDLATGQNLRDLLERGALPVDRTLNIMRQILGGLAHAHRQGIIHRDIKPANIMLSEATGTGDHVRILDFGLATLHDSGLSGDVSESWLIVGTPAYMSPEQSLGKTVDVRTDVYSAGVILFQLLTGEKPYDAEDAFETLKEHREKPIPRLREVCPDVEFPPGLQQLIDRSMAKEPSRRYSSAGKFADALEEVAGGNTGRTPKPMALAPTVQSPIVTVETTRPARRRGSFASMLLAFLLVAGAAGAGAWYLQDISTANTNASEPEPKPSPEPAAGDTPAMPADVRTAPDATVMAAAPPDAAVPDAHPADDGDTDAGDVGGDDEEYVLNLPPDELDEPVAAVEDETAEDDSPAVEPPEPPVPMEIKTIEGAKKLIAAGERERAIAALRKLEREHPKSAYIPYLLGHLYFEKKWWSMGIQEYKVAIRNNRDYRKRSILNKNVIRALGSEKTKSKAISLYLNSIGRSGLKYLRRAAKSDKNKKVRSRANWLIKRLSKKRR